MKSLVVFFSLSGNTRFIAEAIAQAIGADSLELKPTKELRGGNFMKHFWGGKQVVHKEKPELELLEKNAADYDQIVIGTPVWAFTFAPAVRTFFSQVKLAGKKIALFCCCDGMAGKTIENMKKELAGNELVGEIILKRTAKDREVNKAAAISWITQIL